MNVLLFYLARHWQKKALMKWFTSRVNQSLQCQQTKVPQRKEDKCELLIHCIFVLNTGTFKRALKKFKKMNI
jgi:hypothetical protein